MQSIPRSDIKTCRNRVHLFKSRYRTPVTTDDDDLECIAGIPTFGANVKMPRKERRRSYRLRALDGRHVNEHMIPGHGRTDRRYCDRA